MKKQYLYALIAMLISQTYAEYQIIIPLDPKGIIMEETPINGFLTVNLLSDQF